MNYTVARYVTQHSQCSSVQSLAYFAMSFTPHNAHISLLSVGVKFKFSNEHPLLFYMGVPRVSKDLTGNVGRSDGVKSFHHHSLEIINIFQTRETPISTRED